MGDARRIIFLFGSGISRPAGMPLGDEITQQVLSGHGAFYYNDHDYGFGPAYGPGKPRPNGFQDEHVWRIVELLKALNAALQDAPRPAGCGGPNYEELFDAAVQVHHAVQCNDPVESRWGGLVARLNSELAHTWPRKPGESRDWDLAWVAQHVMTYIECVVPHLLNRPATRLDHLGWVAKACRDQDLAGVDIFTLNHDTVLEAALRERELGGRATNGFDAGENDLCHWNPGLYHSPEMRVRLVKLHGGVNWFMFRPIQAALPYYMAMPTGKIEMMRKWKGRGGKEFWLVSPRAVFLTGIQTKINEYRNEVFKPLFSLFRDSLSACSDLVVCGYGFRDAGINRELTDWLGASGDRGMVVIHKKPEELAHAISTFGSEDKVRIVEKWVEEVNWVDLKRQIRP